MKELWTETWNKNGTDINLELKNKAKLAECVKQNYNVILVLNQKRIDYDRIMDGTL